MNYTLNTCHSSEYAFSIVNLDVTTGRRTLDRRLHTVARRRRDARSARRASESTRVHRTRARVSSRARSSVDAVAERPITDRLVRTYKINHVCDDLEDGGADGVSRER